MPDNPDNVVTLPVKVRKHRTVKAMLEEASCAPLGSAILISESEEGTLFMTGSDGEEMTVAEATYLLTSTLHFLMLRHHR